MPRPPFKRQKPNNLQPSRRVANIDSNVSRNELERKLAGKPVGKRPPDSDDSDNLVTKATSARARRNPRNEIYASGAVGKGDSPGAYPTRAQTKQIMTKATNEILTRSRESSRANSATSSPMPSAELPSSFLARHKSEEQQTRPSAVVSPARKAQPVASTVKTTAQTPLPETSILGVIKPRKRQASILQLIDTHDSSSIQSEDEEAFLPDEISTPLELNAKHLDHAKQSVSSSKLSQLKKRKRESNMSNLSNHSSSPIDGRSQLAMFQHPVSSSLALNLPAPSRTQAKALERQKAVEEDIMALPESSDSEASATNIGRPITKPTTQRQITAPSTNQLRSLMPTQRQKSTRRRKQPDEFEIQEDSSPSQPSPTSDQEQHSVFLPHTNTRTKKTRQKKPPIESRNAKVKGTRQAGSIARDKDKIKSTNSTTCTPSTARLRKPLPLSSKQSGNVEAKSPSQKQDFPLGNLPLTRGGRRQQHGGSREHGNDKENSPTRLRAGSSEKAVGEVSVEIAVGSGSRTGHGHQFREASVEAKVWSKRWADIDDFSLAFEDVPVSIESQSPET